jgi:hypothetical protein
MSLFVPLTSNEPTATFVVLPVPQNDGIRVIETGEARQTEDGQIVALD